VVPIDLTEQIRLDTVFRVLAARFGNRADLRPRQQLRIGTVAQRRTPKAPRRYQHATIERLLR